VHARLAQGVARAFRARQAKHSGSAPRNGAALSRPIASSYAGLSTYDRSDRFLTWRHFGPFCAGPCAAPTYIEAADCFTLERHACLELSNAPGSGKHG